MIRLICLTKAIEEFKAAGGSYDEAADLLDTVFGMIPETMTTAVVRLTADDLKEARAGKTRKKPQAH